MHVGARFDDRLPWGRDVGCVVRDAHPLDIEVLLAWNDDRVVAAEDRGDDRYPRVFCTHATNSSKA
jgi:hypothetical protein